MRRVEPFAAQQGPDLAGTRTRVRFPQDLELLGGGESSADVTGRHFGVGRTGHDLALARGRPSATGARSTPILEIMFIKILTPPRPQQ